MFSPKIIGLAAILLLSGVETGSAQTCTDRERYLDAQRHCVDPSPSDVILLGTLRVTGDDTTGKRVLLHDEKLGDIQLILTPGLVQAIDESPAESFEVEGALLTPTQMAVKSLRPIE